MLRYRLMLGPVMIAALIALLWADAYLSSRALGPTGLIATLMGCAVVALAAVEMTALIRARGVAMSATLAAAGSIALGLTAHSALPHTAVPVVLVVIVAALAWHIRRRELSGAMAAAGATLLTVVILGGLGGFWLTIRLHYTVTALVVVLLLTKCGDIGAYFGGRLLGRRKLIPWLSPGKTWEGLVAGVLFAAAMGPVVVRIMDRFDLRAGNLSTDGPGSPTLGVYVFFAALGAALALVGAAGDLMFSLFKRDAGVKDSSRSIPGFGGVLDVIDSPLLTAPVGYWLLMLAESLHLI